MEVEWVQRVPVHTERMREIRETAEKLDIYLTCHAPYYINLNSPDFVKLQASKKRILDALSMSELAGIKSVCVHPAFYMGMDSKKVFETIRKAIDEIMKQKDKLFPHVNLALETMGKPVQFGTLKEVLEISREFGIYPTVDPAHLHARSNGGLNTKEEWTEMLDTYEKYVGKESLKCMHIHFSGIAYSIHGERRHLPLLESDARWQDFLDVLKEMKVGGTLVSESPLLEEDTLRMKRYYETVRYC